MHLDPGQRRTLAVGAVVIAVILLIGRVLPAAHRAEAQALQREQGLRDELDRARQLLAIAEGSDTLAATSRITAIETRVFRGETPAAAAGGLAAVLENLARRTGMEVSASVIRADTAFTQRFAPISTRIVASANAEQLARWLALVENHELMLRIESITISNFTPAAAADQPEALRLDISVGALAIRSQPLVERAQ